MAEPARFDVRTFGALGDGKTDDQTALQATIDACAASGGGVAHVPAGDWRFERLDLRSNVTVALAGGATLRGQLCAEDVHNIAVLGDPERPVELPRGLRCLRVAGFRLANVTARVAAFRWCRGIRVEDCTLLQPWQRQGEGSVIIFWGCEEVYVARCTMECNDDVFCLKGSAANVTLTDSVLRGRLAAPIKIGTETGGYFKHIVVTNCTIYASDRAAISLESVDGAVIDHVFVAGIKMVDVAAPLFIRLGDRDRYGLGIGAVRNITLQDIEAVGMEMDRGIGSSIVGLPGHPVENVALSNVRLTYRGGGRLRTDSVPEQATLYPEYDVFGPLPAYGLYCRHVKGLTLRHVDLGFAQVDARPALICEDIERLELDRVRPMAARDGGPPLVLQNVRDVVIRGCEAPLGPPFVHLADQADAITFLDNDFNRAGTPPVRVAASVEGWLRLPAAALAGDVEFSDLKVGPVTPDRPVEVAVDVRNKGCEGYAAVELVLGSEKAGAGGWAASRLWPSVVDRSEIVDRRWLWLDAGAEATVTLTAPRFYRPRVRTLRVGHLAQQIEVPATPGVLAYREPRMPDAGSSGAPVPVSFEVRNVGGEPHAEVVQLHDSDGQVLAAATLTLDPGEAVETTLSCVFETPGRHTVCAGDLCRTIQIDPFWIDRDGNGLRDESDPSYGSLKAALLDAGAGDTIYVEPGTHLVGASDLPLRLDQAGLTVRSVAGAETTELRAVGADSREWEQHSLFIITADDVAIEGLTLRRSIFAIYGEDVTGSRIEDNVFDAAKRHHVYLIRAEDAVVRGNRSRSALNCAIRLDACEGCLVEANLCHDDPAGVRVFGGAHNTIKRNHFDALAWDGVMLTDSHDNLIVGNLINDGRLTGIQVRGSRRNRIERNVVVGCHTEGILVDREAEANEIHHNTIAGNERLGLSNETPYTVSATDNWWGAANGPSGAGLGSGDGVDANVVYEPWLEAPEQSGRDIQESDN